MDFNFLLKVYAKLFATDAPIIIMALFLGITPGYSPQERWRTALKGTHIAAGLLIACAIFGMGILDFFGINLDTFRIAGGLVLLFIGLELVRNDIEIDDGNPTMNQKPKHDISVTPLAFPIITGPGAFSALIITKAETTNTAQTVSFYIGTMLLIATWYALFYVTCFFSKFLKPPVFKISGRLFGLIVLAISVQFMIAGLLSFIPK